MEFYCVSICEACNIKGCEGLKGLVALKLSTRKMTSKEVEIFASMFCDRMTECIYKCPLETFVSNEEVTLIV